MSETSLSGQDNGAASPGIEQPVVYEIGTFEGEQKAVINRALATSFQQTAKRFRACASCEFGVKEGNDLVCRRNPPQSTFLAMQAMVPGPMGRMVPGFEIKPFTGFPVMRPDQWCGEYSVRG